MMSAGTARHVSVGLASVSVALVVAVGGVYLWLIHRQHEGGPAWWFVAGLCVVVILGLGSLFRAAPGPAVMELVGGAVLLVLGVLGIFSVGLPLLVAGILMLIAAAPAIASRSAPVP